MADVLVVLEPAGPSTRRLLSSLEADGHGFRVIPRASEAEHAARTARFDAVLFDCDAVGRDFVARVRRDHPGHTLIAWSPRSSSAGVAELLETGVDEVVHAGMSEREVAARTAAALRRSGRRATVPIELGLLSLDAVHGEARWDGRDLRLTRREREVLQALAESAGRTVRREALYRQVWGYTMARGDRSVDVNVKRLRRKLAASAGADLQIKTHAGVGYRLELAEREAPAPVTAS